MNSRRVLLKSSIIALGAIGLAGSAVGQSIFPHSSNRSEQWSFIRSFAAQAFNLKEQEKELTGSARNEKRLERVSNFFQAAQWVADYVEAHFSKEQARKTPAFVFVCYSGALFFDNARQWSTAKAWYKWTQKYAAELVASRLAVPDFNGSSIVQLTASRSKRIDQLIEIANKGKSTSTETVTTIDAKWHGSSKFSFEFVNPLPGENEVDSKAAELLEMEEAMLSPPGAIPW